MFEESPENGNNLAVEAVINVGQELKMPQSSKRGEFTQPKIQLKVSLIHLAVLPTLAFPCTGVSASPHFLAKFVSRMKQRLSPTLGTAGETLMRWADERQGLITTNM